MERRVGWHIGSLPLLLVSARSMGFLQRGPLAGSNVAQAGRRAHMPQSTVCLDGGFGDVIESFLACLGVIVTPDVGGSDTNGSIGPHL
jgi:hypothetical protein